MASSLEGNKLLAAVLTAGIMASGAGVIASIIYAPHEPEEPAYLVAAPEGEAEAGEPAAAETAVPLGVLLASADAAAGESESKKCAACHSFEEGGPNKVGPHLWGVVGRPVAAVSDFAYSDALKALGGAWDYEALNGYLADPKGYAPGNKMSFAGIKKNEDRADVILYLASISPDAPPLPAAEAPAAEAPAAEAPAAEAPAAEGGEQQTAEAPAATEAAPATEAPAENAAAEAAPADTAAADTASTDSASTDASATDAAATDTAAADTAATDTAAAAGGTIAAGGDPAAGEKIAKKCKACHTFEADGANKIGPHLFGVVGRDIASVPDFKYSDALQGLEGTWTHDKIAAYVADPKGFAPGNKMSFAGIKKEQELADLVAYLETLH